MTGEMERRIFWEVAVAGMQSEKVVRHERLRRISQLVTNLAWGSLVGYRMCSSRRMNAPTHCQTNLNWLFRPLVARIVFLPVMVDLAGCGMEYMVYVHESRDQAAHFWYFA